MLQPMFPQHRKLIYINQFCFSKYCSHTAVGVLFYFLFIDGNIHISSYTLSVKDYSK